MSAAVRIVVIASLCAGWVQTAFADVVPGLEFYGDLTLVDSIDCAADTTHSFRDYPAGNSYVSNILSRACRVLHHVPTDANKKESGAYVSWRLGEGKGLVPNDPYLLVVDYPDEAPRSAILLNNGAPSRRGFHTGPTLGDSESPPYVMNFLESYHIPYTDKYQQIEQVMFPCEKPAPYNGGTRLSLATDGFDVTFALLPADDAPGSLGVAVAAIRLYRITDESVLKAEINYPDETLPRRVVTWREEMSDDNGHAAYADRMDFYRAKAKLMNVLAINTYSKDQLEFGYCQGWDPTYHNYGSNWYNWDDSIKNDWGHITEIMGAEGHWLLPYYEYAGARGKGNLGDQRIPMPLKDGYQYSNASWVNDCRVDITSEEAKEDFRKVLDCTILRYKDNAKFLGSWIRNRGQMPISFHTNTVVRFCQEAGYSTGTVDRTYIATNGTSSAIYKEYRAWWYAKRAEFLEDMRLYLETNGIENAKSFFTSTIAETGEYGVNWEGMFTVNDTEPWQQACALTGHSRGNGQNVGSSAQTYKNQCLNADWPTWNPYEQEHAAPHDDPLTYTNMTNVALTYPFNRVFTVIWDQKGGANDWRDQNGDLFFVRFYSLNENNLMDTAGKEICGYFTADFEKAGPACMLSELWAMAISDPNMLGYLYGFNLARGFTQPARKFNQNFLSLPATRSEVVYGQGGCWGAKLTVRKWTTNAGNYFAVINTSGETFTNHNVGFAQYGGGKVYETVSHAEHALKGDGSVDIDIGPYEMIAFTTVAPDTPSGSFGAIEAEDVSATVKFRIDSLAGDSGTLTVVCSRNADFSDSVNVYSSAVSAAGEITIPLADLTPSTTYYLRAELVNSAGHGVMRYATFKTPIPADFPIAGAVSVTDVGVTNATFSVAVTRLGAGASGAVVLATLTPEAGGAARVYEAEVRDGTAMFAVGGLDSQRAYVLAAVVSNSLGKVSAADPSGFTTKPVPEVARGTGAWAPGLTQVKLGLPAKGNFDFTLDLLSYGDDVSDIVPGTLMSDVYVSNSYNGDPAVTNPWSGKSWRWAFDMIFAYGGEMYLKGGVTYNFYAAIDDGEGVVINGETLLNKVSWQSSEGASFSVEKDGWYPVQFQFRNGNGGAGIINNTNYNQWVTREMGFGWNTNGVTAQLPESAWSKLRDPGDGSLLRTRGTKPQLVTIPSEIFRNADGLVVPVATELYDDDCTLYVLCGTSIPALNTPENWERAVTIANPDRAVSLRNVETGYTPKPGATVYVVARLVNARTGYDVSTDPAVYTDTNPTPAELSPATAEVAADGTKATLSCTLERAQTFPVEVVLQVNGASVKNWSVTEPSAELSFEAAVVPGSTNVFAFVATDGLGLVTSSSGGFVATVYTAWFTVDFEGDSAYVVGTEWTGVPADRGSWTTEGGAVTELKEEDGVRSVEFAAGEFAEDVPSVVYTPTRPSESGADVIVTGRVRVSPIPSSAPSLAGYPEAKGALCCVKDSGIVPYGYTADGWRPLAGGSALTIGAVADYSIGLAFSGTNGNEVVYTFADWSGGPWPVSDDANRVSRVRFSRSGAFGSVQGAYYSLQPGDEPIVLERPQFTTDGSALAFGGAAGSEGSTFSMTIGNPVKGAYYTVFTATSLNGTFTAEKASVLCDTSAATYTLTVDANTPAKFAKIVISTAPFAAGAELK